MPNNFDPDFTRRLSRVFLEKLDAEQSLSKDFYERFNRLIVQEKRPYTRKDYVYRWFSRFWTWLKK